MHDVATMLEWGLMAFYAVIYGAPAAVVAGLAWWAIKWRRK